MKIKLSLPSRFILVTGIACYLGWFTHSENDEKRLKNLFNRLKNSESDEFSFTRYETELLVDSLNSMDHEYGCSDLELKAHEYLIDKLKRNYKEDKTQKIMNLELTENEFTELKNLLKEFFIDCKKWELNNTNLYSSMIMRTYDLEQIISLRTILGKILTPEELIEVEDQCKL